MNRPLLVLALFWLTLFVLLEPGAAPVSQEGGAAWRSLWQKTARLSASTPVGDSRTVTSPSAPSINKPIVRIKQTTIPKAVAVDEPADTAVSEVRDAVTEASLNQVTSQDQNTGVTHITPAYTGFEIASAEVLGEQGGTDTTVYDESATPPAADAPSWAKLRWIEAIMADGVNEQEAEHLDRLMSSAQDPDITREILSSATLAETSPALRRLIEKGLQTNQAEQVRMLALHLAQDHYPDIVQRTLTDADEVIRLHAEMLLDAGRRGSDFRE